jgi:hypothetical protein
MPDTRPWLPLALYLFLTAGNGYAQTVPLRRTDRDLTIPADAPEYFLDRVSSIAVDRDGSILALLPNQSRVLRFDRAGKYQEQWGRAGSGPGELRGAWLMGWHHDTLWVFDAASSRISLFSPHGRLVRTMPLPAVGTGYLQQDGSVVALSVMTFPTGHGQGPPIVVRRFVHGALADTLVALPPTYRVMEYQTGGATVVGMQPFEDGPLVTGARDGSGVVVVHRSGGNGRVRIVRIGSAGDTIFDRYLKFAPQRLTSTVVDSAVNELATQGPASRDPELRSKIRRALYLPSSLPTVTEAIIAGDSTIWLRREMTWGPTVRWTVLSRAGMPLFELALPTRLRIAAAAAHAIWGVLPDTNDAPTVVRFRILD